MTTIPAPRFGIFIPVGPQKDEDERLIDLLDSIFVYEPDVAHVLVIDDSTNARLSAERFKQSYGFTVMTIQHPRCGCGNGLRGAQFASDLLAARWFSAETDCEFVVKIDTDGLVIDSFAARLQRAFEQHPRAGMVGVLGRTCGHTPPQWGTYREVTEAMESLLGAIPGEADDGWVEGQTTGVTIERIGHIEPTQLRQLTVLRKLLASAIDQGYVLGQYIQGGAYAISRSFIGYLSSVSDIYPPEAWYEVPITEDVLMSVYSIASGHLMCNSFQAENVFGVQYRGLPALPASLLQQGYAIVHSVKNDPCVPEKAIRAMFRSLRRKQNKSRKIVGVNSPFIP